MKRWKVALLLLLWPALAAELKPFTTDGCSAFPDGTPAHRDLWLNCCIQHDLAYWKGGTHTERLNADRRVLFSPGRPWCRGLA